MGRMHILCHAGKWRSEGLQLKNNCIENEPKCLCIGAGLYVVLFFDDLDVTKGVNLKSNRLSGFFTPFLCEGVWRFNRVFSRSKPRNPSVNQEYWSG